MKTGILFCAAALLAASNAQAQSSWPIILKDASVTVALDTAGIDLNADGSYLTRTRWDYSKLHALESKRPYMAMTQSTLLKCTPVRVKRLTESFYSANGAVIREGQMVNARDIPYMTWDRLKTGSDASKAFNSACALLKRKR
ncbi:MAG: surface-adhesin E family protein [Gemmatimonadales bacterium]